MPPIVWSTVGLAVGVATAEKSVWFEYVGGVSLAWTAAALLVAAFVAMASAVIAMRRLAAFSMLAAGLAAGLLVGGACWLEQRATSESALKLGSSHWLLVVASDVSSGQFGQSAVCELRTEHRAIGQVRARWPKGSTPPSLGQAIEVYGTLSSARIQDAAEQDFQNGLVGNMSVRVVRGRRWDAGLKGVMGRVRAWADSRVPRVQGDGPSVLASTLLGEKYRLAGSEAEADMQVAGLAHMQSTSGFHIVLLCSVLEAMLLGLSVGPRMRVAGTVLLAGAFVALAGARVSAIRSWGTAMIGSAGRLAGRRPTGIGTLAAAAAAFICVSPSSVFDVGFQLSVLGVAGIVVFGRLASEWLRQVLPRAARWSADGLAITLCAVAATLPLTASAFGMVSLVAPASNLVAVPLVMVEFVLGVVGMGVSLVWGQAGSVILSAACAFGAMLADVAAWFAALPHASVPAAAASPLCVATGALGAGALWAWWPQPTAVRARAAFGLGVLGCLVVAIGIPTPVSEPEIVVMDVGQGDAILVQDRGHELLVDTGPDAKHILPALARNSVRRVDGVVITHLHADHYGGLESVSELMRVPRVLLPWGTMAKSSATLERITRQSRGAVTELAAGDHVHVGRIDLEVVCPSSPVLNAATNEASVVMVAREGSESVLLTGDAEAGVLQPACDAGRLGKIDVLKVGHHGSAISLSQPLLDVLRPGCAVISVGANNRFGHPKREALEFLKSNSIPTYRTDRNGDVCVRFTSRGCEVSASHGGAGVGERAAASGNAAAVGPAPQTFLHKLGMVVSRCATLNRESASLQPWPERHVRVAFRSQVRLPHLRQRGPPARPSRRSSSPKSCRGRGPRLQLRGIRRGERGCRRCRGRKQHAAVLVGAPTRRRARGRQDDEIGAGHTRDLRG